MEREQAELFSELAMVALLRFLDALQVRLQLALAEERRPVDPLHRLVARVPFQYAFDVLNSLNALSFPVEGTWGRTEVDEGLAVLDRVTGNLGLAFRLFLDQLHLERFMPGREKSFVLRPADHLALVGQILRRPAPSSFSMASRSSGTNGRSTTKS